MGTPFKFHTSLSQPPLYNHRPSPPLRPSLPPNHLLRRQNLQPSQQGLQQHGGSRLAMRQLAFQRISPNRIINFNFNSLYRSQFTMSGQNQAKEEKTLSVDASKSALITNQEPEKSEPIPPPPEKPLPGDCCGSGCVRCVWDVYYEELEEYNNLLKTKSEPIANPKSS